MKSWGTFLTESKQPIEEASEEEIASLDDVLLSLDPKDLSFNNIFGDKTRIAVPLGTEGIKTETEKFLNKAGYTVDMKTGIATGYTLSSGEGDSKNTRKLTQDQQTSYVTPEGKINVSRLGLEDKPEKVAQMQRNLRRRQMKIGKLLKKGLDLVEKVESAPNREARLDALNKYNQFFAKPTISDAGDDTMTRMSFEEQMKIWEKRGATKSGHTVVVSRHPLDVFRMSDFDRIQSCHSPPSRGDQGGGSYYQCAVAEAHGHGLVAYLVRNEDLDNVIDERELDKGDYQGLLDDYERYEEEFFYDDYREEGDVTPINRVRIRKYASPKFNMTIAVPDIEVYGDNRGLNDALVNTMVKWTQGEQEDAIKKMKDDEDMLRNGMFNLDNWIQHGGTYQDTPPAALLSRFLDDERFPNVGYFAGSMEIDRTTENDLSVGSLSQIEEEVTDAIQEFNRRSFALKVEDTGPDIDNEDGNFVIPVRAAMKVSIPESEFAQSAYQSATRAAIESLPDYLSDYLPVSQDKDVYYRAASGAVVIDIPIDVESVHGNQGGFGGNFAFGVDNFQDILASLDRIDDNHEQFEQAVREALVNEGVLQGTPIQEFAKMYNDNSYYEWDSDMDYRSNPTQIDLETRQFVNLEDLIKKIPVTLDRSYTPGGLNAFIPVMFDGKEIAEVYRVYDNQDLEETNVIGYEVISGEFENRKSEVLPDLKAVIPYVQRQIAKMLVTYRTIGGVSQASRDYHIAVREEFRKAVGGEEGDYSYPPSVLYGSGPDSDDEYDMRYQIQLTDNSSEGQFDAAEKIVNDVDDEDELKAIFRRAFAKAAKVPVATNENVRDYFKKFDIFG